MFHRKYCTLANLKKAKALHRIHIRLHYANKRKIKKSVKNININYFDSLVLFRIVPDCNLYNQPRVRFKPLSLPPKKRLIASPNFSILWKEEHLHKLKCYYK